MWQLIEQSLYRAKSNRVYIIPTINGLKLFVANIIMLAMGLVYSNNFLLLFNFILFSFFIITMFYTHFNLSNLKLTKLEFEDVFVGKKADIFLQFFQDNKEPRYTIKTIIALNEFLVSSSENIDPNGEMHASVFPMKRGKYSISKISFSTNFPFNLFQSFISFETNQIIHIFPEIIHYNEFEFFQEQRLSDNQSNIGIKKYNQGENPNRIIWRKSYTDNLISKHMAPDGFDHLVLDIRNTKLSEAEVSKITSIAVNKYHEQKNLKIITDHSDYFIDPEQPPTLKVFLNYMASYEQ